MRGTGIRTSLSLLVAAAVTWGALAWLAPARVGADVVHLESGGRIVGEAHSRVVIGHDPTAHGEVEAIRDAARARARGLRVATNDAPGGNRARSRET